MLWVPCPQCSRLLRHPFANTMPGSKNSIVQGTGVVCQCGARVAMPDMFSGSTGGVFIRPGAVPEFLLDLRVSQRVRDAKSITDIIEAVEGTPLAPIIPTLKRVGKDHAMLIITLLLAVFQSAHDWYSRVTADKAIQELQRSIDEKVQSLIDAINRSAEDPQPPGTRRERF